MDWIFRGQTDADIDRIAEAHFDRLWDLYWGTDEEDAWDHDNPGWEDIADLVDSFSWPEICDIVRDFIEGDGDLMTAVCMAGGADPFILPEERWMLKDPDTAWTLADRVFDREWENNALMQAVYLWMPEDQLRQMAERLMERADENGIRDKYNDSRRD